MRQSLGRAWGRVSAEPQMEAWLRLLLRHVWESQIPYKTSKVRLLRRLVEGDRGRGKIR